MDPSFHSEFPCTLYTTIYESAAVILNAVKNLNDEILRYAQDDNCVEEGRSCDYSNAIITMTTSL